MIRINSYSTYTGAEADLPLTLPSGDRYLCTDSGNVYVYIDGSPEITSEKLPAGTTLLKLVDAPATANSPGNVGEYAIDTSFIYKVVSQDVWQRSSLPFATW